MKKEKFFAVRQLAGQKKERVLAEGYRVERGEFVFYVCGSGGSWSVTAAKSGMLIGVYGKARKECIDRGEYRAKMHIENVFCFWYYKND